MCPRLVEAIIRVILQMKDDSFIADKAFDRLMRGNQLPGEDVFQFALTMNSENLSLRSLAETSVKPGSSLVEIS